jgi:hypothetical protein
MKKYFVLLWLLLPLPLIVLHFGRGQQWLARDRAHAIIIRGQEAEQREDWKTADELYNQAAGFISSDQKDIKLRIDLARVRTSHRSGEAMAAIDGSISLLDDAAFSTMPVEFRREAREVAARVHYYSAWVMRLEGASRELWMEQAELARQNFRLLAEKENADASAEYVQSQKVNLESSIQLQRLGLTDLMARPLPKEGQCKCNKGLSEQMGQRKGNKKAKSKSKGSQQNGAGSPRFEPGQGS